MRRIVVTTLAALSLAALAQPAAAQDGDARIGLGLGLSNLVLLDFESVLMPIVYVPIMASERVMIEPGIGLARLSEGEDDFESTFTLLSLGAGLLFLTPVGDGDRVYLGPRIGVLRASSDSGPGDDDDSSTNLTIAGVVGGEFFLRSHFSLGGEVGLRYLKFDEGDDESSSLLSTLAEFRVRWYFP